MTKIGVVFLCLGVIPGLAEEHSHPETGAPIQLQSAEVLFSNRLHSGLLEFGLAKNRAGVLSQYYGSETYRVGAVGIGPNLGFGGWLTLLPGFSAAIIKNEAAQGLHGETSAHAAHTPPAYRPVDPAFSLRWKMHLGGRSLAVVSEGAYLQALLATGHVRNFYMDGAHVSLKFRRLEGGFTPALANHWKERERKRGGRIGLYLGKGFGLVGMVLWPGKPDYRGGLYYTIHQ